MARTRNSQSKHNKSVQKEANQLEQQGFDVTADIAGFPKPLTIERVRPDIDANKGKKRVIVEVETKDSIDGARAQRKKQAFQKAAKRSRNTTFQQTTV